MTNIIVAINVIFHVCLDRRDDFLASLDTVLSHHPRCVFENDSNIHPTTLLQAVFGEDLKDEATFHCHFKFSCPSLEYVQKRIQANEHNSNNDNDTTEHHPIFWHGVSPEWKAWEDSNPFTQEPICHAWIVAPSTHNMENPKLNTHHQQFFCLNANLYIPPQHRHFLLQLLEHARSCSIREPLCREYQYGESLITPNVFHVHQAYLGANGGKEGFDVHGKTAHYQRWKDFAATKPFTQDPQGFPFRSMKNHYFHSSDEDNQSEGKKRNTSSDSKTLELEDTTIHKKPKTSADVLQHDSSTITLLDGGNGHELKLRGVIKSDGSFLAGMLANEQHPRLVEEVHRDFVRSNCQVITTNSFVAVPARIQQDIVAMSSCSRSEEDVKNDDFQQILQERQRETVHQRTKEIIRAAVQCAKRVAREESNHTNSGGQRIRVAGTVPPLTECYMAQLVPQDLEDLTSQYSWLLATLLEAKVDILLAETLTTSREALAIIRAYSIHLKSTPDSAAFIIPLWISMTIDDDNPRTLRSGEPLDEAFKTILKEAEMHGVPLEAIGVNCASPTAVTRAIARVTKTINDHQLPLEIIAYANGFQTTTSEWLASQSTASSSNSNEHVNQQRRESKTDFDKTGMIHPEVYAKYAAKWKDLGATIIGGCCGISPKHMQLVSETLAKANA